MTIFENNEELGRMVEFLDAKVLEFRRRYPKSDYLKDIRNFYDMYISPWMADYNIGNKEPDKKYDETLKNRILDRCNEIEDVSKEQSNKQ